MMYSILVIEDDRTLAEGLRRALTGAAQTADACCTIAEAEDRLSTGSYDLLLLDVNLPDGNGLDFLTKLRQTSRIPVILLTANDMETDIVTGLETGADDYITKPFSLAVLRARVAARLRARREEADAQTTVCESPDPLRHAPFRFDTYRFDFDRMEFSRAGVMIDLSKTEQKLLRLLVENADITLSRSYLIDRIWTDGAAYVDENALSLAVKRLRDKLSAHSYIKTIYGIGYTWVKPQARTITDTRRRNPC